MVALIRVHTRSIRESWRKTPMAFRARGSVSTLALFRFEFRMSGVLLRSAMGASRLSISILAADYNLFCLSVFTGLPWYHSVGTIAIFGSMSTVISLRSPSALTGSSGTVDERTSTWNWSQNILVLAVSDMCKRIYHNLTASTSTQY